MEFILLSILCFLLWNYCYNVSQSGLIALILFQKEIQTVKTTVDYANFIYYKKRSRHVPTLVQGQVTEV